MTGIGRFYPIAGTAEEVERVAALGARFIQLRFKSTDRAHIVEEVSRALASCRHYHAQLVVNDHWEVALEQGASYIHLGQEDLETADLTRIRRGGLKLGVSTHSHEELNKALAVKPDYVALGPIWETTLKVMPWKPQGLERVREWATLIDPLPLVAIGGVTLARCRSCLEAGAHSVAVVSDIFRHSDLEGQTRKWQQALGEVS
ncbi:thiamine phosphate synthase [Saccharibacter sp. 17.LH.SD]|uniref:thiamine phosphate synthase n=1 Tax=Saccharibacter sp. 17.LH.SD TaxID=2689393 RepID=UPI0013692D58|nr:thiamine phosphate synthase [Saccharibacter sp. 17.LH.SD]MXV44461.1 thiamine phosphate synthase [Saccharibacter sp. 17.LH.SD]